MNCENCGHQNPDGARFCAGCGGPIPLGSPDAAYPLLGQVVGGRYHIVELIGEGGMGVVYKAEQRLGSAIRKVAVKTLHAELSRDPSITARFHREVGTIAQLEHPNTVRVYDFGSTDDGTLYIAMEFLAGRALNKVIESDGPLEPKRVAHLLRQITGSLDEAHRQGIVHRDLKPENVILIERAGEKDVVKLVDFGIAARTESADREKEQKLTQQGMVLGTPPYMSPEQFTGRALDARSDVYSLGVMTYEMLTGQLPFQADTPWQWATHHMTSQPRSFDEVPSGGRIPEALRRTVLKALAKDPGERQGSAGQFFAEFNAALGGLPSVMPVPATAVRGDGKTEAMPEATPMAIAATVAMAAPPGPGAPAAPAVVALPPAPPRQEARGGKGLIYGLGGLAAVLGVAIVVALGGEGGGEENAPPLDFTPTSEQPAAPAAPESPTPAPSEPEVAEPEQPPEPKSPKPASTTKPASSKTPTPSKTPSQTPATPAPTPTTPPPAPPAQPPPSPPVQQPPPATPPTTPPVVTAPTDPCQACGTALNEGDFAKAATYYAACSNPGGKARCSTRAGGLARTQAKHAALNGDCTRAKAIVDAVTRMGIARSKFNEALKTCP